MHVLVPGRWTIKRGHDLSERIERDITRALPMSTVFIHVEPLEDPASWQDQELDRSSEERRDADPR
jgi:divalent metal cation (Fe/Co/Zn/Cd) transporter